VCAGADGISKTIDKGNSRKKQSNCGRYHISYQNKITANSFFRCNRLCLLHASALFIIFFWILLSGMIPSLVLVVAFKRWREGRKGKKTGKAVGAVGLTDAED
jgi:hypothetical protein